MKAIFGALALAFLVMTGGAANAAGQTLTNQDIVTMVQGNVAQDVILSAIQAADTDFDVTTPGLVALSNLGVPNTVIQAMIQAEKADAAPPPPAPKPVVTIPALNPDDVTMIAGGDTAQLHYSTADERTAVRNLGFGGLVKYAVLKGPKAALRIKDGHPAFLIVVSNNARLQGYATLVVLKVRDDATREVATGKGYTSIATEIDQASIIDAAYDKAEDQSRAPAGYTIYKITPMQTLGSDEYALILEGGRYYDFGID
jgi:hypothetical protein